MPHPDIRLDIAPPPLKSNRHISIWYLDVINIHKDLSSSSTPNKISDPVRLPRIKRVISAFLDFCL